MARPKRVDRPVEKTISLPSTIVAAVDLELYSQLEGRVPFGAWQKLLVTLLQQHLSRPAGQTRLEHAVAAGIPGEPAPGRQAFLFAEQRLAAAVEAMTKLLMQYEQRSHGNARVTAIRLIQEEAGNADPA